MKSTNYKLLKSIAVAYGPNPEEHKALDDLINLVDSKEEAMHFREILGDVLKKENTLFGHTYEKPFGYAGDFLLIEKIYEKYVTENPKYKKWDLFYHSHEATEAVRNRKKYFIEKMKEIVTSKKEVNVLILGSGPASDVFEFCQTNDSENIFFDLLDIDKNAIEYARKKNEKYLKNINFIEANVIKYSTDKKYDFIWSAGLFDYLNDKLFVALLKRFKDNLTTDGKIIIGNFSPSNPTIKVMEVMTEWYLNYRDEEHLLALAKAANINTEKCMIEKEPLSINLFLKIEG